MLPRQQAEAGTHRDRPQEDLQALLLVQVAVVEPLLVAGAPPQAGALALERLPTRA